MNQGCYRLVFNVARGQVMVVGETAAQGGHLGCSASSQNPKPNKPLSLINNARLAIHSIALAILALGLPVVSTAQIKADTNAPGNQRPTVLSAPNGVPLVNIQTPSAAGVSRNTYSQFDVQQQGAILNNSRVNTPTQLGGWVQGNPWLATGSARVILNEVNSSNPTQLRGYVEVAGPRTEVIIANPAGIQVNGGGFINTSRVTLSTGPAVFGPTGAVEGYQVRQGVVSLEGLGLDASTSSHTTILARAIDVNAALWANYLQVLAGANQVSVDANGETTATPMTPAANMAPPQFAIDVKLLGGMYAGKIFLVGSEQGVGVRVNNDGYISADEIVITADGRLTSQKLIQAQAKLQLSASAIQNSGQILAGGDATLKASTSLDNSGRISSAGQINLSAASINNSNTSAAQQGIAGNSLSLTANSLNNDNGTIRSAGNTQLNISNTLSNQGGLISAGTTLATAATQNPTLNIQNANGTLIAGSLLSAQAASLSGNANSQLLSQQDLSLLLTGDYANSGQILANGNLTLSVPGVFSNSGQVQAGGALDLSANTVDNSATGQITGTSTRLTANSSIVNRGLIDGQSTWFSAPTISNIGTGRIYGDNLSLAATTLNNTPETVAGITSAPVIAARNRLDIGVQTINNGQDALLFSAGDWALGGSLDSQQQASGQAAMVNNLSGTLEALGSLAVSAQQVNNINTDIRTQQVQTGSVNIDEYALEGSVQRWPASQVRFYDDEATGLITPEGISDTFSQSWYNWKYTRVTTETQLLTSQPGKILAGGDLLLQAGSVLNNNSQIVAGGVLSAQVGSLTNQEIDATRVATDSGMLHHWYRHSVSGGRDYSDVDSFSYQPPPTVTAIALSPLLYQGGTAPSGSGTPLSARHGLGALGTSVQLPSSSLFRLQPQLQSNYLVESDARFTNYRQWLSSDYLLKALGFDPNTTQKRLGDGFYEQRLVREQVAQLTGRQLLANYSDDEAQYRALLDNASTVAQAWQLVPGVALSAAQVAQLTSDIVWLVEKSVTLADGSTQKVLVPQVYMRVRPGDLNGYGALLGGDSVYLQATGDLKTGGTIAGRRVVALNADNIHALGGRIRAGDVALRSAQDMNLQGASVEADNSLTLAAGRDLNLRSTTRTQSNAQGSRTAMDRVASLYVSNPDGVLLATAGRDANLLGAQIINAGEGGSTALSAGRDLNLGTVRQAQQEAAVWSSQHYRQEASSADVGSSIQTLGAIQLSAGQDLRAQAANVASAAGTVDISAQRDVTLGSGQLNQSVDAANRTRSKGFLSSTTTVTRDHMNQSLAQGSSLSGERVKVQAGRDVRVQGSDVLAIQDVNVNAGRDLSIESASNTRDESHYRHSKKSGLLSASPTSVTVGTRSVKDESDSHSVTQTSSQLQSLSGNVNLNAGRDARVVASNIDAAQDLNLSARNVDISAADNQYVENQRHEVKQSGLTVSLGGPGSQAALDVQQKAQKFLQAQDPKLQALYGITAARATYDSVKDIAQQAQQGHAPSIGINIGLSTSTQVSASHTDASQAQGSHLSAGQALHITARGEKDAQDNYIAGSGNLNVVGSHLSGNTVALTAANDLNLLSAQDRSMSGERSDSRSAGVTLGVSAGAGQGVQASVGVNTALAQTNSHSSSVQQVGSVVRATERVSLRSGRDVNVVASQVLAQDLRVDAARDINLFSAQDIDAMYSNNRSVRGGVNASLSWAGGAAFGGSVGAQASAQTGKSSTNSVSQVNSLLLGSHSVTLDSGRDTTLRGAQVMGEKIDVDAGRNLSLQSLQDTERSSVSQHSASASGSLGFGAQVGSNSFSASYQRQNGQADYASVREQTGIYAGSGGFDVSVGGHTALIGAVIASEAGAAKNQLQTGSLSASTIENQASYQASTLGVSASISSDGKTQQAKASLLPDMPQRDSGSQASTTRSAVSPGSITLTAPGQDSSTLASLSRDTTNTHTVLARNPDLSRLLQQQKEVAAATAEASKAVGKTVGDIASNRQRAAAQDRAAAQSKLAAGTDAQGQPLSDSQRAQLEAQITDAAEREARWGEGGIYRASLHAAGGALIAGLGGGNAAQGAAGAFASQMLTHQTQAIAQALTAQLSIDHPLLASALSELVTNVSSTFVGALVGGSSGAVTAAAMDSYNRQLHPSEVSRIQMLAKGDRKKEARLLAAACALVHCSAEYPENSRGWIYYQQIEKAGQGFTEELALLGKQTELNDVLYARYGYESYRSLFSYNQVDRLADLAMGQVNMHPRIVAGGAALLGVAGVVSGATSTAALGALCPETGVSCAAAVFTGTGTAIAFDYATASGRYAITGERATPFGEQLMVAMGLSPETARQVEMIAGIVTPLAGGGLSLIRAPVLEALTTTNTVTGRLFVQNATDNLALEVEVGLGANGGGKVAGVVDDAVATGRPTPRQSEIDVGVDLPPGARPQISFRNGQEVPYGTSGSVRPDYCLGNVCSVEVKNYNITTNSNGLVSNVSQQAIDRAANLPPGMTQRIVIDVRGQTYSPQQLADIRLQIVQRSNGTISPRNIEFKDK